MTNRFSKQFFDTISAPTKGRSYFHDDKERGLSAYVTSTGSVTFYTRKRVDGRDVRLIIGNYPDLSIEQARKLAASYKGQVAIGQDPAAEKRRRKADNLTFGAHFKDYMDRYSKLHKRSWKYDEREVTRFLSHWLNRRLSTITKIEVQAIHEKLYKENGLYQANRILERIRAIFNKAIEWGWDGKNPTAGIKKFKEQSRDRFLQPDELPRFFAALAADESQTLKDYVLISLLTGGRKTNVLMMTWDQISWDRKEWRIPVTKNGDVVVVPLIERAIDVLARRKTTALSNSPWVFPSENAKSGYYADPSRGWDRVLKRAEINDLRIHDIRRTLGSYQAITGASMQIIGKSLGHKSQHATQVYSRLHTDPVRQSIEKATDSILSFATLPSENSGQNSGAANGSSN